MGEARPATGRERIVAALNERSHALAGDSLRRMRAEIPGYSEIDDPALIRDVLEHIRENHDAIRETIASGEPVTVEALEFVRPHATMRARRGVALSDFVHAWHIGMTDVWRTIVEGAGDDVEGLRAALEAAGSVMDYIDHASSQAAEAYIEARQLLVAEADRVHRDLVEDLLAGRAPTGPRLAATRAAGLVADARCFAIVASPVGEPPDEFALRSAAGRIARELGGPVTPLAVARRDEVVVIVAVGTREPASFAEGLQRAWRWLRDDGTPLAIGVSPSQSSPTGVADAYADALVARDRLPAEGGVLFLPDMALVDYMATRRDETALRLVPRQLRAFVDEDAATGGVLTQTLREYVAADLNARVAAERLFIHVNTAYQRLERIAERTGLDLRRFADVQELLLAIKLVQAHADDT